MNESDRYLLERIRRLVARREGVTERKMFGGVCILLHGNICVGTWKGSLVVRMDKATHDQNLTLPHARPFDVTGKVMRGWAIVDPFGIDTDSELEQWIDRAYQYVATLPAKP